MGENLSDRSSPTAARMERVLGLGRLLLYGIGALIGSGVFTINGVASKVAGTGIALSWLVSGAFIMLSTFMFAELSTKIPKSGSSYKYAYVIAGEIQAWTIGWNTFMQYGILAAVQG